MIVMPGSPLAAQQRGTTFIELIASIVVISIATFGLMLAISSVVGRSADPLVQNQAAAIAEAYLEEATLVGFCDPDFLATTASGRCRIECTTSVCGGCGDRTTYQEASRDLYDDVCDFAAVTNAVITDRLGNPIVDLARYRVSLDVLDDAVALGAPAINGAAGQVVRIEVSVTHPALSEPVVLSTHRANTR